MSQTVSVAGSQPAAKGPAEYFTGNVRVDPLFAAKDTAPFSGAYVTFEPGARSAWHTHPAGQHLLVTAGGLGLLLYIAMAIIVKMTVKASPKPKAARPISDLPEPTSPASPTTSPARASGLLG